MDKVSSEDRLLQLNIHQGYERKAETLQWILFVLVIENHPVCGEVELTSLAGLELLIILTRELNADLAGVDEDCFSAVEQDTSRGVGCVQRYFLHWALFTCRHTFTQIVFSVT